MVIHTFRTLWLCHAPTYLLPRPAALVSPARRGRRRRASEGRRVHSAAAHVDGSFLRGDPSLRRGELRPQLIDRRHLRDLNLAHDRRQRRERQPLVGDGRRLPATRGRRVSASSRRRVAATIGRRTVATAGRRVTGTTGQCPRTPRNRYPRVTRSCRRCPPPSPSPYTRTGMGFFLFHLALSVDIVSHRTRCGRFRVMYCPPGGIFALKDRGEEMRSFFLVYSALSPLNFTLIGNDDFCTNLVWNNWCF